MENKKKIYILGLILLFLILLFLFYGLDSVIFKFALSLRLPRLAALILVASSIAFGATVFQTITQNRILTPSVLGLDSLYLFIQSLTVFIFGSSALIELGEKFNFLLSVLLMGLFALVLFKILFKDEENSIFLLLLMGLVFGTFFRSLSTFMQVLIDPNEFFIIQDRMFASFNNLNTELLGMAFAAIVLLLVMIYRQLNTLDVLSLGREEAINLGVDYDRVVKNLFIITSVLVAISTALVGPITFLGLLVVNVAKEMFKSYKHSCLLAASMLISSIALVGGQFLASHVFDFAAPISVVINFVGGIYLIILLLKESRI